MALRKLQFGLVLIAAIAATCGTATAQQKRDPRLVIQDCVTYLRMFELQHRIIETETFTLGTLKDARAKQAVGGQSPAAAPADPKPADQTGQASPAAAPVDYDIEIGKLAFTIEKDRRVLTAIEHRYKECLKAPPWEVAKANAKTRAAAKKPPAKRTSARSSRPTTEGRGSPPPQGGHSPGASGLMGIIGGGGVGVGF
jgi:hypothetical protein